MVSVEALKEEFGELGVDPSEDVADKCKYPQKGDQISIKLFVIDLLSFPDSPIAMQVLRFAQFTASMIQSSLLRNGWRTAFHISVELSRHFSTSTTLKIKNCGTRARQM